MAIALVLPFISWLSASKATAQVQVKPQWAVVPFVNGMPQNGGAKYSDTATSNIFDELTKTQQYDVLPVDSVKSSIEQLNLQSPVTDPTSLLRLAQDLNVQTLVTGKLVGWEVYRVSGGKQAKVALQVEVLNVASGLAINGAAIITTSSVRSSSTDQDTVVDDALSQAAAEAVAKIQSQVLPAATVLNTRNTEGLINRGARDGFEDGQEVIVTRGREQVATAKVFGVEPDSASIKIIRETKGIQPGDRVQVVFQVPDVTLKGANAGNPQFVVHQPAKALDSTAIISAGLVLGAVAFFLSGGRSNSNNSVDNVQNQATTYPAYSNNPVIQISWTLDVFYRNSNNVEWIIYRSDQSTNPVQVQTNGNATNVFDDPNPKTITVASGLPQISASVTCTPFGAAVVTAPGILIGAPYQYGVQGVYRVLSVDLPSTTTTTATTTTTTATVSTGASYCYFVSTTTYSNGFATALGAPILENPSLDQTVTGFGPFTFTSLETPNSTIAIAYVVQVSDSPLFPANQTVTSPEVVSEDVNDLSISFTPRSSSDTFLAFLEDHFGPSFKGGQLFWRVGARNVQDYPGPVPDPATGLRYIFCSSSAFTVGSSTAPKKTAKNTKSNTKTTKTTKTTTTKKGSNLKQSLPKQTAGAKTSGS